MIYRACESKFIGESAFGVGKATYVLVLKQDLTYEAFWPEDVDRYIRPDWERVGTPPLPPEASKRIDQNLRKLAWGTPKPRS